MVLFLARRGFLVVAIGAGGIGGETGESEEDNDGNEFGAAGLL